MKAAANCTLAVALLASLTALTLSLSPGTLEDLLILAQALWFFLAPLVCSNLSVRLWKLNLN